MSGATQPEAKSEPSMLYQRCKNHKKVHAEFYCSEEKQHYCPGCIPDHKSQSHRVITIPEGCAQLAQPWISLNAEITAIIDQLLPVQARIPPVNKIKMEERLKKFQKKFDKVKRYRDCGRYADLTDEAKGVTKYKYKVADYLNLLITAFTGDCGVPEAHSSSNIANYSVAQNQSPQKVNLVESGEPLLDSALKFAVTQEDLKESYNDDIASLTYLNDASYVPAFTQNQELVHGSQDNNTQPEPDSQEIEAPPVAVQSQELGPCHTYHQEQVVDQ